MKKTKFLLAAFICFLALGTSFAQNAKQVEKATAKMEELNAQITAEDASLALTEAQQEKIVGIYAKQFKALAQVRKGTGTDEEKKMQRKEITKANNQVIYKEILTKEQRLARKATKEKTGKG